MNTCLVYFDETGDDGANTLSSNQFVLTSIYMQTDTWQENFNKIRNCRKELKDSIFPKRSIPSILSGTRDFTAPMAGQTSSVETF